MSDKETNKDVHTEHCCILHGCEYDAGSDCPVESGQKKQSFMCEWCDETFSADWYTAHVMNEMYDKGRQSVIDVILPRVDGLPNHPWIPGFMFADGEILRALGEGE